MEFRDDAKKRAHKEAQVKIMMILMCIKIKFNKKKAYLSQFIFVKCVIFSPLLNLLINRRKFRLEFSYQSNQNLKLHIQYGVVSKQMTVCLTVSGKLEV